MGCSWKTAFRQPFWKLSAGLGLSFQFILGNRLAGSETLSFQHSLVSGLCAPLRRLFLGSDVRAGRGAVEDDALDTLVAPILHAARGVDSHRRHGLAEVRVANACGGDLPVPPCTHTKVRASPTFPAPCRVAVSTWSRFSRSSESYEASTHHPARRGSSVVHFFTSRAGVCWLLGCWPLRLTFALQRGPSTCPYCV